MKTPQSPLWGSDLEEEEMLKYPPNNTSTPMMRRTQPEEEQSPTKAKVTHSIVDEACVDAEDGPVKVLEAREARGVPEAHCVVH